MVSTLMRVFLIGLGVFWLGIGGLWAESAFKITFSTDRRSHGSNWNGGVEDVSRLRGLWGWHLHDEDRLLAPNRWRIVTRSVGGDVAAPGVVLGVGGPESAPFTFYTRSGDTSFVPGGVLYGSPHAPATLGGNVLIERVPSPVIVSGPSDEDDSPALIRTRSGEFWLAWVAYQTVRRDGYYLDGADRVMVARSEDGIGWSEPKAITPPGDHFRAALGEAADGEIWCVYSQQLALGSGNFDLYGRAWRDGDWADAERLTSDPRPDAFHRLAATDDGALYLVWAGFRDGMDGGASQSDVLARRFADGTWGAEQNLTRSAEDEWEPAVAAAPEGSAWVAWDRYGDAGFDLQMTSWDGGAVSEAMDVSATPYSEMRADVAVDGDGRVWVSWEEGSVNWGKDYGYQNPKHQIYLKDGSRIYDPRGPRKARVAVWDGATWKQPASSPVANAAEFLNPALFQNPRLAVDGRGDVWVLMRHQWRTHGRFGGHFFDFYATTWRDDGWIAPVLLPGSTGRQDTVVASAPAGEDSLVVAVVGDGRRMPVGLPKHHDVSVARIEGAEVAGRRATPRLVDFELSEAREYAPTHPAEAADLAQVRGHRAEVGGERWKIFRGDLHRHTEISMDGALDGSLYDAYRYALNAAQLDFLGVSDHNYGQWLDTDEPEYPQSDNEFQFWRTQKSADLFYVPGRFVPLYGYERTTNFPLGHRNVFHAVRGVFSLRVPRLHVREQPDLVDSDPPKLWTYLRRTGGVGIPHTPASTMGTNWERRNDEVIPVTEIYQGDRNSYEAEGAVRAAVPDAVGPGRAGAAPHQDGLVQNALGVGYRMGFIASSDHFSTHISYANLIVPDGETTREDLLDALRQRRTYASTDNIVVDFHAEGVQQGSEIVAAQSPVFRVHVAGTAPVRAVEVIKNNRVVYTHRGDGSAEVRFEYRDADFGETSMGETATIRDWGRPETGIRARADETERFYYLRVVQSFSEAEREKAGEVAWSSPIWVVGE